MTDWRSSDDPARGAQNPPQYPGYGSPDPAGGAQRYPQDPNVPDPNAQAQYPYGQNPYGQGQYGQDPYGQNPYQQNPYQQNPYAQHPGGYAQPGYGYPAVPGYGPIDPADRRPGTLLSAAVLGYVTGGLLIIAGVICFAGASTLQDLTNDFGGDTNGYTAQFVLAGVANIVAAGLLIAGSVSMANRNANGRVLYSVGCGIVIAATIYWLAQWATKDGLAGLSVYAFLFAALVIVGAALAFTGGGNRWLAGKRH